MYRSMKYKIIEKKDGYEVRVYRSGRIIHKSFHKERFHAEIRAENEMEYWRLVDYHE